MAAYSPDNIFAKIIAGLVPSHRVFEDAEALAFMDLMPHSKGHTLVVPKKGSRNLLDADPEVLAKLIVRVQKIAMAVRIAFSADGLRINQFNEEPAGQTVFHLHFHIIPIYQGVPMRAQTGEMADPNELAAHAEAIRAALK
ncbi:MAG: HIT family protein [Cucumibacter sp.]